MAAATKMKIITKIVMPTIAHMPLPLNARGKGPRKMMPVDLNFPSSLGLKLSSSKMVPIPVMARPRPRRGAETLNVILPSLEGTES